MLLRLRCASSGTQTGSGLAANPGEAVPPRAARERTNAQRSPGGNREQREHQVSIGELPGHKWRKERTGYLGLANP